MIDATLLARYQKPVPRYTSYPTADRFHDGFGPDDHLRALDRSAAAQRPLAYYVHLPFCAEMCAYCGCNMVVSRTPATHQRYLERLHREIDAVAAHLDPRQVSTGVHFGGGTPNLYDPVAIAGIVEALELITPFAPDAERSIEIDPRQARPGDITELFAAGFTRLSMGVQDFDAAVQDAIGRHQSFAMTVACVDEARRAGFWSVNTDLIYGLPRQTQLSMDRTLDHVVQLSPDRIALFGYAHMPHLRKNQLRIAPDDLPDAALRLALYEQAKHRLEGAGYIAIGLDHFARPDDPLAVAQKERTLHRSFQGYTTVGGVDLVGFGMSAISQVGDAYAQNAKKIDAYNAAIDAGQLATIRGLQIDDVDLVRAYAIEQLMCNLQLRWRDLEDRFAVGLRALHREVERLRPLVADGLITLDANGIEVTAVGQPLVRHVAAAFDRFLATTDEGGRYSAAI